MTYRDVSEPVLSPGLVERILARLGLSDRPSLDLDGLNALFAAFCGNVPIIDNTLKRIWLVSDRTTPLTAGILPSISKTFCCTEPEVPAIRQMAHCAH